MYIELWKESYFRQELTKQCTWLKKSATFDGAGVKNAPMNQQPSIGSALACSGTILVTMVRVTVACNRSCVLWPSRKVTFDRHRCNSALLSAFHDVIRVANTVSPYAFTMTLWFSGT